MSNSIEKECIRLLSDSICQYSLMCHSMITDVRDNEQLSLTSFAKLDKAQLSALHVTRSMNMLFSLIGLDRTRDELYPQSFNISQMLESMCKTVTKVLSVLPDFSLKYEIPPGSDHKSIVIDRSRFELITFNIIHYCLNCCSDLSRAIKIKIVAKETDSDFIFSVIDVDSPPIDNPFDLLVFQNTETDNYEDLAPLSANLGAVSLLVAKKLALHTDCNLSYKRLKNSNQYTLSIPKNIFKPNTNGISIYETNMFTLLETFSYILLPFYQE